jgi:hypothetical protein
MEVIMKWKHIQDVPDKATFVLKKSLFTVQEGLDPYMHYTQEELDKYISRDHKAGAIFTYDKENTVLNCPGNGSIGVDDELSSDLWEMMEFRYDLAGEGEDRSVQVTFDERKCICQSLDPNASVVVKNLSLIESP